VLKARGYAENRRMPVFKVTCYQNARFFVSPYLVAGASSGHKMLWKISVDKASLPV
jgi:hypothetical protein